MESCLVDLDRRLLELRADHLAARALVAACDEAIRGLEALAEVERGRSRVPALALQRLTGCRDDWAEAVEQISRGIAAEAARLISPSAAEHAR